MTILVYSKFNSKNIQASLGKSEYSYYFVLRKFLPVLETIGEVQLIEDPEDVPVYQAQAQKEEKKCVLLCFTAPHHLDLNLSGQIIPVFAWEYDTIPNESWGGNEKNNWVKVLRKIGAAITHSEHSAAVIRRELGPDFPILACPAPVEESLLLPQYDVQKKTIRKQFELIINKKVIDSERLKLTPLDMPKGFAKRIELTHILLQTWAHEVLEDLLPKSLYRFFRNLYLFTGTTIAKTVRFFKYSNTQTPSPSSKQTDADTNIYEGIIYTSILNISDKRKNYMDMVAAFCHALGDRTDATLILKTPVMEDVYFFRQKVTGFLQSLPAFKCRVVVVGNYLDKAAYQNLMNATTFYVNTSYGEGQCLPLMEFMSAGIPAIAPYATALKDYINDANAFVVKTGATPTCWQHDERIAIRTVHHRPDWYSLVTAYQESYQVAKNDETKYRDMAWQAAQTLRAHAGFEKTKHKLSHFLTKQLSD